jgi:hypothetical protein
MQKDAKFHFFVDIKREIVGWGNALGFIDSRLRQLIV